MLLLERMSLTLKGKVLTPVTIKASDVFVHSNSSCKFFLDGKHTSECGTLSYPILKMIDFVNEQSLAAVLSQYGSTRSSSRMQHLAENWYMRVMDALGSFCHALNQYLAFGSGSFGPKVSQILLSGKILMLEAQKPSKIQSMGAVVSIHSKK